MIYKSETPSRLLRYFYYVLNFICACDYGVWISPAIENHNIKHFLLNCYPLMISGSIIIFFILIKVIVFFSFETICTDLATKLSSSFIGLLLFSTLTVVAIPYFLFGSQTSVLALVLFVAGISPVFIFSILLTFSKDFWELICTTSFMLLILPYENKSEGFYNIQITISAFIAVSGLVFGIIIRNII